MQSKETGKRFDKFRAPIRKAGSALAGAAATLAIISPSFADAPRVSSHDLLDNLPYTAQVEPLISACPVSAAGQTRLEKVGRTQAELDVTTGNAVILKLGLRTEAEKPGTKTPYPGNAGFGNPLASGNDVYVRCSVDQNTN